MREFDKNSGFVDLRISLHVDESLNHMEKAVIVNPRPCGQGPSHFTAHSVLKSGMV